MKIGKLFLASISLMFGFVCFSVAISSFSESDFGTGSVGLVISFPFFYWSLNVLSNGKLNQIITKSFSNKPKKLSTEEYNHQLDIKIKEHLESPKKVNYTYNKSFFEKYNFPKLMGEFPKDYVVLDFETTGLETYNSRIIEFACIRIRDCVIVDTIQSLIDPEQNIPQNIVNLVGIDNEMVKDAPKIYEEIQNLVDFIGEDTLVGHNVLFDLKFLIVACLGLNDKFTSNFAVLDTVDYARKYFPNLENYKLPTIKEYLKIETESHRALCDATVANTIYLKCKEMEESSQELNRFTLEQTIKSFIDEERQFYDSILEKVKKCDENYDLRVNRMANNTLNFTVDEKQIGRVKLRGKKTIQIMTRSDVLWIDVLTVDQAIENSNYWIKYLKSI